MEQTPRCKNIFLSSVSQFVKIFSKMQFQEHFGMGLSFYGKIVGLSNSQRIFSLNSWHLKWSHNLSLSLDLPPVCSRLYMAWLSESYPPLQSSTHLLKKIHEGLKKKLPLTNFKFIYEKKLWCWKPPPLPVISWTYYLTDLKGVVHIYKAMINSLLFHLYIWANPRYLIWLIDHKISTNT